MSPVHTAAQRFALIGAAGYIAPRHMQAIRDTGNELVAALDPSDSAGILDRYFPDTHFFTAFERFDRHIDKLRRQRDAAIGYISICSPNYLHDAHMRFALRSDADAICEKPLVLNPWNLDGLELLEAETGKKIHSLLLLRLHPAIASLKEEIDAAPAGSRHEVDLTYITPRGRWYFASWKGDEQLSGGISTNIGVHFFDMLQYLFGPVQHTELHHKSTHRESGYMEYEKARVRWFLSVDAADLPPALHGEGLRSYRMIRVNGTEREFSAGFTDLHTEAYRAILSGKTWGLQESRPAIETIAQLRAMQPFATGKDLHPLLQKIN